jgi:hypothetical protein
VSNDLFEILGIIAFGLIILSILADTVLSATWSRTYFTVGLPIFIMRVPVDFPHTNIPQRSLFEAQFQSNLVASLTFKEISSNEYGFREAHFQFRLFGYSPLMHGLLIFDYENSQVVVKGFINWFTLCFSLIWLSIAMFMIPFVLFFIILMGCLYLIQLSRFSKVAAFAAEAWSRKHVRNVAGA